MYNTREKTNDLHKPISEFLVQSYSRVNVYHTTKENFLLEFRRLAFAHPVKTSIHTIKGEIFLTNVAFSKLVKYDNDLTDIFYPEVVHEHNIVGFINCNGSVKRVRTTALQKNSEIDYEGLAEGQMELRLFS